LNPEDEGQACLNDEETYEEIGREKDNNSDIQSSPEHSEEEAYPSLPL